MVTRHTRREVIEAPRKAAKVSRVALPCPNRTKNFIRHPILANRCYLQKWQHGMIHTKNQRTGTAESVDQRQNLGEPNSRPRWQTDQQAKKTFRSIRPQEASG